MRHLMFLTLATTIMFIALSALAIAQAPTSSDAKQKYDTAVADVQRMWDAVRKASPEFAKRFCATRNGVCVPDWADFKSPVGGWRLIDPKRCEVDPKPCSVGPRIPLSDQNFTSTQPPGSGWIASWLPCDVYPHPDNPSVLQCDDTCGCAILRANLQVSGAAIPMNAVAARK
jgi:hypothetical protein